MKYIIILFALLIVGCENEAELKAYQDQAHINAMNFAKRFGHNVDCMDRPEDIAYMYPYGHVSCNGLTSNGLQVKFTCDKHSCEY